MERNLFRWRNPGCFWFWCTRSFLLLLGGYLHHRSLALLLCPSQEDATPVVHLEQVAAVETTLETIGLVSPQLGPC